MRKLLWIVLVLVALVFGFLVSQGLYTSVEVQQGEQGGFILLGMDHVGPYAEIGNAFTALKELHPDGEFSGVYFDDPETVAADSLRAFAGVRVTTAEGLDQMAKHHTLRLHHIERRPSHFIDWPHGSNLVGILLGTFKAYPALGEASAATGFSGGDVIAYETYGPDGVRYVMQY